MLFVECVVDFCDFGWWVLVRFCGVEVLCELE